jgi:hypothetical protein
MMLIRIQLTHTRTQRNASNAHAQVRVRLGRPTTERLQVDHGCPSPCLRGQAPLLLLRHAIPRLAPTRTQPQPRMDMDLETQMDMEAPTPVRMGTCCVLGRRSLPSKRMSRTARCRTGLWPSSRRLFQVINIGQGHSRNGIESARCTDKEATSAGSPSTRLWMQKSRRCQLFTLLHMHRVFADAWTSSVPSFAVLGPQHDANWCLSQMRPSRSATLHTSITSLNTSPARSSARFTQRRHASTAHMSYLGLSAQRWWRKRGTGRMSRG